jgi:hypothetical protein
MDFRGDATMKTKGFSILTTVCCLLAYTCTTVWATDDPGWPREHTGADGTKLVVYQPQVDSWKGHRQIQARVAVAITPPQGEHSILGVLWIEADTDTMPATRTVVLTNIQVVRANFPTLSPEEADRMTSELKSHLPRGPMNFALDRVLANMAATQEQSRSADLAMAPPTIFYSEQPAVLVLFDGKPVLSPIEGTDLLFAVNTNWNLFFQTGTSRYYLLDEKSWLQASDLNGSWSPAGTLPPSFSKIPDTENWKDVRSNLPGQPIQESAVPHVFVSETPAELIMTKGAPTLTPIEGTTLLSVTNTSSDLFLYSGDGEYYYLVSGRWFKAKSLNGPWTSATTALPADFAKIPPEGSRGSVLPSVPGTPEAQEAVLLAQIPQTATVRRSEAKVTVTYAGEPQFKPISGTTMQYAVNTSFDVIWVGDLYYVCFQGVWFRSTTPQGPWVVADNVPQQIYTIPPSSPMYHVTYVRVYESTPDTVVVGYTSGYMGVYPYGGTVVFGTGYYYPPYVWASGPIPVYYPYPYSYGTAAYYNPYTGAYGRGAAVYGPYGGAGAASYYNPTTGTYARGAAVYGPYGGAGTAVVYNPRTGAYARGVSTYGPDGGTTDAWGYNPRTGTSASTHQQYNAYAQWGNSVVTRGGETTQMGHYTNDQGTIAGFDSTTGAKGVGYHGADNSGGVVKTQDGDIYAGRDGNAYKKTDDGWSKYSDGGWTPVDPTHNLKSGTQPVSSESQASRAEARSEQSAQVPDTAARQSPTRSAATPQASSPERGASNWDATHEQLDRDFSARSSGEARTQNYSSWRDRFGAAEGGQQRSGDLGGEQQRFGAFGGGQQRFESFGGERPRFGVGRGGGGLLRR